MPLRSIVRTLGPQLSDEALTSLERALNVRLPDPYRSFLLRSNGGKPDPQYVPVQNNPYDAHAILDLLFGVGTGNSLDLEQNARTYRDRMPGNLLPIATDPGGNIFCLSVAGDDRGTVYLWDHEEEALDGRAPGYDNLYLIAPSFDDMLELLSDRV